MLPVVGWKFQKLKFGGESLRPQKPKEMAQLQIRAPQEKQIQNLLPENYLWWQTFFLDAIILPTKLCFNLSDTKLEL